MQPASGPKIGTRAQLETLLENILRLQAEREELERALENEIAAVRERYRAPLAELEHYLTLETSWAETWARANPREFTDQRLDCAGATLGFRITPPRIDRASRRWTWSRIAEALAETEWGKGYLRTPPPEADREALQADLEKLSALDLHDAGLKVVQGDRFYVRPKDAPTPVEEKWEEAA